MLSQSEIYVYEEKSEIQRKIYRMNVCDGMQISEIAIKLDVKYKKVENRLCAARKE